MGVAQASSILQHMPSRGSTWYTSTPKEENVWNNASPGSSELSTVAEIPVTATMTVTPAILVGDGEKLSTVPRGVLGCDLGVVHLYSEVYGREIHRVYQYLHSKYLQGKGGGRGGGGGGRKRYLI